MNFIFRFMQMFSNIIGDVPSILDIIPSTIEWNEIKTNSRGFSTKYVFLIVFVKKFVQMMSNSRLILELKSFILQMLVWIKLILLPLYGYILRKWDYKSGLVVIIILIERRWQTVLMPVDAHPFNLNHDRATTTK